MNIRINQQLSYVVQSFSSRVFKLAVDQNARALEAVEMIAGSYGKKELGGKGKGVEGEDGGGLMDEAINYNII